MLDGVEHIKELRLVLSDDEDLRPPQIRANLLRLHGLSMDVVRHGDRAKARSLFHLVADLNMQVSR